MVLHNVLKILLGHSGPPTSYLLPPVREGPLSLVLFVSGNFILDHRVKGEIQKVGEEPDEGSEVLIRGGQSSLWLAETLLCATRVFIPVRRTRGSDRTDASRT